VIDGFAIAEGSERETIDREGMVHWTVNAKSPGESSADD
jgi:hypothetical protein